MVQGFLWLPIALSTVWAFGALWFDFPLSAWSAHAAVAYVVLVMMSCLALRGGWLAMGSTILGTALVTGWWWTLRPLQYRDWKPEVALTARADVDGDTVTIHNVRNFQYRSESDFDPRYETRHVRLSALRGVDLFLNYWGSPWMAHPIISFDFGPDGKICFSVETRSERSESYSVLRGLYRGFELICIAADERDVIRLRTNCRTGEQTYLYRLDAPHAREAFLEYTKLINQLHAKPKWYNAITQNCTTSLRSQRDPKERTPWDWRMLVNGYLDELLYEREKIDTTLPFAELKQKSLINPKAKTLDQDPDFSKGIREGLPGF
jgi:hypothetical protein